MEVIGEATSNEEALNFISANPPMVAVLNINHEKFSGVDAAHRINRNFPSVSVILATDVDDEEHLFSALRCGASAYFTKDIDPGDLVDIIRKVAHGEKPIGEALLRKEIASRVINEFEAFALLGEQVGNVFASLSTTEADILRRLAEGSSSEQIAQALTVDQEAIEHHLGLILSKLVSNDHNRELIAAAQQGLPSIITKTGKPPADYVTREEFNAFKESLGERLKSFITGLG